MKLSQQNIDRIKSQFSELTTKEDMVTLLNEVNCMLYGENCHNLKLKRLAYYSNPKLCKKRYSSFTVPKKNGGERIIHAPVNGLKHILRPLNVILNALAEPHFKATGFVPEKSIVDNAKQHVGNHYVYNIDLKDFFHSFDRKWVKYGFMIPPFNLGKEKEDLAFFLASLCTHPFEVGGKLKTVLPQGAPTSPTITNILCVKLDRRLNGLAKRFKINYSRYADDISFSSQTNIFKKDKFLDELRRIIEADQKLLINPKKTRIQKTGFRQEVTGLTVNTKVNVNTRYVKQLRMWLYYWEKYGYTKAEKIFRKDYAMDKGHIKKGTPNFKNVLRGKLEYLKMVKGERDSTYTKLETRFEKLMSKNSIEEELLLTWENEGIEKAMELLEMSSNTKETVSTKNRGFNNKSDFEVIL